MNKNNINFKTESDDGFSDFFDEEEGKLEDRATKQEDTWDNENQTQDWNNQAEEDFNNQTEELNDESQDWNNQADEEFDNQDQTEVNQNKDIILYLVVDRPLSGLITYYRECGVNVTKIFDSITSAKNTILMQSDPCRVVVIDSGLGKFTTTSMRTELIDMLGISDEQNKTTVFYTDSALKMDTMRALGKSGKGIDWIPYKSTSVIAATLLSYKEHYVTGFNSQTDTKEKEKDLLNFKGLSLGGYVPTTLDINGFSAESIRLHVTEAEDNPLDGYTINI